MKINSKRLKTDQKSMNNLRGLCSYNRAIKKYLKIKF